LLYSRDEGDSTVLVAQTNPLAYDFEQIV
jgi:hypothetical protein